eukprot:657471-Pelagomonas_calceolata.AAC.1
MLDSSFQDCTLGDAAVTVAPAGLFAGTSSASAKLASYASTVKKPSPVPPGALAGACARGDPPAPRALFAYAAPLPTLFLMPDVPLPWIDTLLPQNRGPRLGWQRFHAKRKENVKQGTCSMLCSLLNSFENWTVASAGCWSTITAPQIQQAGR